MSRERRAGARRWLLPGVMLAVLGAGAVMARVPADLLQVVSALPAAQRDALQAQAVRWQRWTDAQRAAFADRAARWDALPWQERRQRREEWAAWTALTPVEQAQLRAAAARYGALPADEQQALRQKFESLDPTTRRGWMLGPALGAGYTPLQPLLAYVPAEEHAPLLRTLRAMTPLQRADLAVLVWRTPPQARDRLRRELVSTSDDNRAAWLQLRLER